MPVAALYGRPRGGHADAASWLAWRGLHSGASGAADDGESGRGSGVFGGIFDEVRRAARVTLKSASATASLLADPKGPVVDTSGMSDAAASEIEQASNMSALDLSALMGNELQFLAKNIKKLIESNHPVLHRVAKYYVDLEGKKVRPMIVLLVSRAVAPIPAVNPVPPLGDDWVLPSQRRLAEITELIHTASLVHDDVIDTADTRRSVVSVNQVFGNKMAVLGGDFLLARASLELARLRNVEVIELLSTVIANLVEGEFMQLAPPTDQATRAEQNFDLYMAKTFKKTASLIAHSAQAAAILGGQDTEIAGHCFDYGRHLGLAFQLVDDHLDFVSSNETLGKPASADLKLGLSTAPVLFAAKQYDELHDMMERQFEREGDVEAARNMVLESSGLEQTMELAKHHADSAVAAISNLPDTPARDALVALTDKVISRKH